MISTLTLMVAFGRRAPPKALGLRADDTHDAYWPHPKTKHAAALAAALQLLSARP